MTLQASFDVIGDVHGCAGELRELLERLGYALEETDGRARVAPPDGRRAVFLGDLIDRGPENPAVVELVMDMVDAGTADCLLGNHEHQLLEHLAGRAPVAWGLAETLEQLADRPELLERLVRFSRGLPHWLWLDGERLLAVHAGLPEKLQRKDSARARNFALYGHPTRKARLDWAPDYRGTARVVYGHTPSDTLYWVNRTLCIDTGCVYGGALTALRYPELELVSVEARRRHYAGA